MGPEGFTPNFLEKNLIKKKSIKCFTLNGPDGSRGVRTPDHSVSLLGLRASPQMLEVFDLAIRVLNISEIPYVDGLIKL